MKYLKLFEDNEFSVGDIVNVSSAIIKDDVGRITKIDGKIVTLNVGGKNHKVSIRNISSNNSIDPFDEDDWNEVDETRKKLNDNIASYIDGDIVTIHRGVMEYRRGIEDFEFDGDTIVLTLVKSALNTFRPRSLINLENYIYDSNFVEGVQFTWDNKVEILLSTDYTYEED